MIEDECIKDDSVKITGKYYLSNLLWGENSFILLSLKDANCIWMKQTGQISRGKIRARQIRKSQTNKEVNARNRDHEKPISKVVTRIHVALPRRRKRQIGKNID